MKKTPDDLLREWATSRSADEEHIRKLTARIETAARRARNQPKPRLAPARWLVAFATAGAAAVIAVMISRPGHLPDAPTHPPNDGLQAARIPEEGARAGESLFCRLEELFNDQLRWVAESGDEVSLGVSPIAGGNLPGARPLMVRLVMLSKADSEDQWKLAWRRDVITRSQELIEIAADSLSPSSINLWMLPVENGRVAVETLLDIQKPFSADARVSALVDDGVPQEILSLSIGGTSYKVLQTVRLLDKKNDCS